MEFKIIEIFPVPNADRWSFLHFLNQYNNLHKKGKNR